ncbi:hypothetical protein FRC07_001825 [Ceratobasidium sp. 392]|nr:hypothetical protein FRC07_001825 [Ceratobasidium sp. 392]
MGVSGVAVDVIDNTESISQEIATLQLSAEHKSPHAEPGSRGGGLQSHDQEPLVSYPEIQMMEDQSQHASAMHQKDQAGEISLDTWHPIPITLPFDFAVQLQYLKNITEYLPANMPEGDAASALGIFQYGLSDITSRHLGADLWQAIDPLLNRVIGSNINSKLLGKQLTTGKCGLMGLYNGFIGLVLHHGIDAGLLEGKLKVVIDAALSR